jgi:hypothetical protein
MSKRTELIGLTGFIALVIAYITAPQLVAGVWWNLGQVVLGWF